MADASVADEAAHDPERREVHESQEGGDEWYLGSDRRRRSSRIHKLQARAGCFDKDKVTEKVLQVAKDAKELLKEREEEGASRLADMLASKRTVLRTDRRKRDESAAASSGAQGGSTPGGSTSKRIPRHIVVTWGIDDEKDDDTLRNLLGELDGEDVDGDTSEDSGDDDDTESNLERGKPVSAQKLERILDSIDDVREVIDDKEIADATSHVDDRFRVPEVVVEEFFPEAERDACATKQEDEISSMYYQAVEKLSRLVAGLRPASDWTSDSDVLLTGPAILTHLWLDP